MKKKIFWIVAGLALIFGALTHELFGSPPTLDTRYSGAYALPDESFVYISPEGEDVLRFRTLSGQSGLLWRASKHFAGGKGFAEREPEFNRFTFDIDQSGQVTALNWEQSGIASVHAARVPLSEQIVTFVSGDVQLRGKLVMPQGAGPYPTVLFIGGFDETSRVDEAFEPYLYASRGFATLVFDPRGTGESQGEYTQNLRVLATDALAALKWLRDQPGIVGVNVNLIGMSEGGWIAPMVAARDGRVRSVLIGSGPLVSAFEADRWRYVSAMKNAGFEAAIPEADRINNILSDIVDRGQDRWSDLDSALDAAKNEPWFDALIGSSSMLGEIAHSSPPLWAQRLKVWWMLRKDPPFTDRFYDPVPAAAALKMPSYWIFGEQDSTMPTEWTIEALNKLQRQRNPVDYLTYPEAGHSILRAERLSDGNRRILGYEPDYFKIQIDWLKRNTSPQLRFSERAP